MSLGIGFTLDSSPSSSSSSLSSLGNGGIIDVTKPLDFSNLSSDAINKYINEMFNDLKSRDKAVEQQVTDLQQALQKSAEEQKLEAEDYQKKFEEIVRAVSLALAQSAVAANGGSADAGRNSLMETLFDPFDRVFTKWKFRVKGGKPEELQEKKEVDKKIGILFSVHFRNSLTAAVDFETSNQSIKPEQRFDRRSILLKAQEQYFQKKHNGHSIISLLVEEGMLMGLQSALNNPECEYLLDVKTDDKVAATPIHFAVVLKQDAALKKLLDACRRGRTTPQQLRQALIATQGEGMTPLELAVVTNNASATKILLDFSSQNDCAGPLPFRVPVLFTTINFPGKQEPHADSLRELLEVPVYAQHLLNEVNHPQLTETPLNNTLHQADRRRTQLVDHPKDLVKGTPEIDTAKQAGLRYSILKYLLLAELFASKGANINDPKRRNGMEANPTSREYILVFFGSDIVKNYFVNEGSSTSKEIVEVINRLVAMCV